MVDELVKRWKLVRVIPLSLALTVADPGIVDVCIPRRIVALRIAPTKLCPHHVLRKTGTRVWKFYASKVQSLEALGLKFNHFSSEYSPWRS